MVQGGVLQGRQLERRLLDWRHAERHGVDGGDGERHRKWLRRQHGQRREL